jgi:hypothetical protein
MKRFPEGISSGQIRHELEREGIPPGDLGQIARRIRELDKWFIIEKMMIAQTAVGDTRVMGDEGQITETLRAGVLYRARGRCQRCGKTIKTDSIALVVRRRRAKYWGDDYNHDNLWAICEECNAGKKSHFVRPMITGARPRFKSCRMSTIGRKSQYTR